MDANDSLSEPLPWPLAFHVAVCILFIESILSLVASSFALKIQCVSSSDLASFACSLCLSDVVASLFGVFKAAVHLIQPQWVHCVLMESLLWCSILASTLTLLMLAIELNLRSELRGLDPLTSSYAMVLLWNVAFIVGFAAHMDMQPSNVQPVFRCHAMHFYAPAFVMVLNCTLLVSLVLAIALHFRLRHRAFCSAVSPDCLRLHRLLLGAHLVCFLPVSIFMLLFCKSIGVLHEAEDESHTTNTILMFFMTLAAAKSPFCSFILVMNTPKLSCRTICCPRTSDHNSNSLRPTLTPVTSLTLCEESKVISDPTPTVLMPSKAMRCLGAGVPIQCSACGHVNVLHRRQATCRPTPFVSSHQDSSVM
ncbi:hypothetical protein CAPTEDRAFT_204173 [Capitella teleta]|uniref:G-protein coupled receptors family 1 profile domain-containing protein n=1 Tax=Capitella teleta TaxID=283909 RepID=R7TB94_CAPTE|nr:hypothetical protein CAPTEDRAFT_204173 [Capitella teleta]|eukprot:ELT88279.1 hypothetical protein CAPTEDRAFT_204173 [Capitella teleta]